MQNSNIDIIIFLTSFTEILPLKHEFRIVMSIRASVLYFSKSYIKLYNMLQRNYFTTVNNINGKLQADIEKYVSPKNGANVIKENNIKKIQFKKRAQKIYIYHPPVTLMLVT